MFPEIRVNCKGSPVALGDVLDGLFGNVILALKDCFSKATRLWCFLLLPYSIGPLQK